MVAKSTLRGEYEANINSRYESVHPVGHISLTSYRVVLNNEKDKM